MSVSLSTIAVPMIDHASSIVALGEIAIGVLITLDGVAAEVDAAVAAVLPSEGAHAFREIARARASESVIASGGMAAGRSAGERSERKERDARRKEQENCLGRGSVCLGVFTSPSMNQRRVVWNTQHYLCCA